MPKSKTDRDAVTFTITINGAELIRWHNLAQKQGVSLEQLVKESVELAWVRGSTR